MPTLTTLFTSIFLLLSLNLVFAAYDEAQAFEYAYASALTHCDVSNIKAWDCGQACKNLTGYQVYYAEVIKVASNQNFTFAMIQNPEKKRFVTTYRGTVGSFQLLLEVLEGDPVPYELADIPGALADDYFYTHYISYLQPLMIPLLKQAYQTFPDYTFVFTGHSMGAALTTLTAFDAITQGIIPREKTVMYNYGSPRVGNSQLADAINKAIPELYRITHWRDLVPHVPPCSINASNECIANATGYSGFGLWPAYHVGPEVFYNEDSSTHIVCNGGENPMCADQFSLLQTSWAFHDQYLTVWMNCDNKHDKVENLWTDSPKKFMRGVEMI